MKNFLKWIFVSPIYFLGLYLIGLCSKNFRIEVIEISKTILKSALQHIERSL